MIDIFLQKDVKKLFKNKNIVFMGDSNMRALYKDTLCLLNQSKLISQKTLKTKGETSCFGDKLVFIGPRYNGREYKEERNGIYDSTTISFYFLTRVYDDYVNQIVKNLSRDPRSVPDVLLINSCLWDVTRYGPNGVKLYKKNLVLLMQDLKKRIPDCLVIWVTAPPIACNPSGGFIVKEIEFLKYSIRFHVVEANQYARKVVVDHGFDVMDSHYHLKLQIHRRTPDGIHWFPLAVRYVTNLLLTHISIAWNVTLPHRFKCESLGANLSTISEEEEAITPKKVSSVVVKPNIFEKVTNDKQRENNKKKAENFTTPKKSKKRKKRPERKSNNLQESHHSYIKRMESRERHNRIRQWKKPDENFPSNMGPVEVRCSSYSNQGDLKYHTNSKSYIAYEQHRIINSPRHVPLLRSPCIRNNDGFPISPLNHTFYATYDQQRFIDSPRHIPLPLGPYPPPNNAFFNSPLHEFKTGMHTPLQMYNTSPITNIQISPYRSFPNEVCQGSYWSNLQYDNNSMSNQLQFQPKIDFASTDAIPFGLKF